MKITSQFRTLFIIRKILGIVFILAFGWFFINLTFQKKEWEILSIILFLEAILLYFFIRSLQKIYSIVVVEIGIFKTSILNNKTEFILYKEIKTVHSEKVQGSSTEAGQITLGYFESVLITYSNQKILISPDNFENYNEIMQAIKLNRRNHSD